MSETEDMESIQRLESVNKIVEGIRHAYPDAKKLKLDIKFAWAESDEYEIDAELCPVVSIEMER
jgi:hypothetical protein